jgi:putative PEP-CTERM system TPR-repeat lipoprotein
VKQLRHALLAVCVAWAVAACGLIDNPIRDRAALDAAIKNGNYRVAVELGRKLTQSDPGDPNNRLMLARALLLAGDAEAAYLEAKQAQSDGLAASQVGQVMAEALLRKADYRGALEIADARELFSANTAAMGRVRGFAHLGLGQPAEARREFAAVLEAEPGDTHTLLALASAVEYEEGPAAAVATLRRAVTQYPDNYVLSLALGDAQVRAGDLTADATYSAVEKVARDQKDNELLAAALYAAGGAALSKNDLPEAKARLAELTKLVPDAGGTKLLGARLAVTERRVPDALKQLRALLARDAGDIDARLLLASVLSVQGSAEEAQQELETVLRQRPGDARARRMIAELLLAQNRVQEALRYIPAVDSASDSAMLQVGGRAQLQLGDWQSAAKYFRESVNAAPGDERARVELAASYVAGGRYEDALAALSEGRNGGARSIGAQLVRLRALAAKGDKQAALAIAEEMADSTNDDAARIAAAQGYLQLGEQARARSVLDGVAKRAGERSSAAWLAIAELELAAGRANQSAAAAARAVEVDGSGVSTLMLAAALARARGANDAAHELYERAIAANKAALEPRLALASLAIDRGDYATATRHVADLRTLAPKSPQVARLASALAVREGDSKQAVAILEPVVKGVPNDSEAQADLALAYLSQRRVADAAKTIDTALATNDKSVRVVSAAVMVALAGGRPQMARTRLQQLEKLNEVPQELLADLQGEVNAASGDFSAAAKAFGASYAARPTAAAAMKEFRARTAARAGDPAEPLRRWLAQVPSDANVLTLLGQHLESTGDVTGAAGAYQKAIDAGGSSVVALNNLAWIRLTQSRVDEALRLARRAHAAEPNSPQIGDTLGRALIESGNAREAVPVLSRAHAAAPQDLSIRYRLALALARDGQQSAALSHLAAITEGSQQFPELPDARKLLAELRSDG